MSKDTAIVVLGFFVALMPFLGFPSLWETIFFVLAGVCIAILAFLLRKEVLMGISHSTIGKEKKTDMYVENGVRKPVPSAGEGEDYTSKNPTSLNNDGVTPPTV